MPRKRAHEAENYNDAFPRNLRALMESRGKTQQDIAEYIQKTRQAVGYYADGSSNPDWKTIVQLAKFFDVTTDYLLGLSLSERQEFHRFSEQTHFSNSTVYRLLELSNFGKESPVGKRTKITFEYLVCSQQLLEILGLLCDYLDVNEGLDDTSELIDMYLDLDSHVNEVSKGNFHVVSSPLFSQTLIARAQQKISELFEQVKKQIDTAGGWGQYMPKQKATPVRRHQDGQNNKDAGK